MKGTPDTMIYWLAAAAKYLREQAGRKQIHIAASLGLDQSTIYRFEQGNYWVRNVDALVAAYAEDLDIPDARDVWALAVRLWQERGEAPSLTHEEGANVATNLREMLATPSGAPGGLPELDPALLPDVGAESPGGQGQGQRRRGRPRSRRSKSA